MLGLKDLAAIVAEHGEALDVALIVGGSITIPHVRRAYGDLEGLRATTDE